MTLSSRPPLRLSVVQTGDTAVLRAEGELDYATAPELERRLSEVLADPRPKRILVDAEGLSFADVSGLDPLIRQAMSLGPGVIRIRNAPRPVARVIRLLDMADLFGLDG
ncbi:MAG: STAS domain-containing protein [Frankiales bacterium]|nr:STAS domain-containing protein [Frankiales bacterium]